MRLDPETRSMIAANEANWDARTPIHLESQFYSARTRDPAEWFADYEWDDLGDLRGKDVAHLQCHIGAETLAFAQRGARTAGLDFSAESVAAAAALAAERGVPVEYVKADVYDAAEALGHGRFDLVYTGKGALQFLPELGPWAEQVAALLKPGGRCYAVEFHPLLWSLGAVPDGTDDLVLRGDYLSGRGHRAEDGTHTYTDGPPLPSAREFFQWSHGIGDVVTALIGVGLRITGLRESPELPWQRWASMVPVGGVWHRLPDDAPRIPLLYAVSAVKP